MSGVDFHYVECQTGFLWSPARFNLCAAGRRSGKTMISKRRGTQKFIDSWRLGRSDYVWLCGAPTYEQSRKVYWKEEPTLHQLIPQEAIKRVWESTMTIETWWGAEARLVGLDRPERAEGTHADHASLDEGADLKPEVWPNTVRPLLSTLGREGSADIFGRPRGRNWFYDLFWRAQTGDLGDDWAAWHWTSEEVLDPKEIVAAKSELDPRTYQQEYLASFLNREGLTYYCWDRDTHCRRLEYDPSLPLDFSFDFNAAPGVAVVSQEQRATVKIDGTEVARFPDLPLLRSTFTAVLGEVWIPQDSNTHRVCDALVQKWGHHRGFVRCFGDATGARRQTSSREGQGGDWRIIQRELSKHYGPGVVRLMVPRRNPAERDRVNSVNARLMSTDGQIGFLVDHAGAPHGPLDFEGVTNKEGGDFEIDKDSSPSMTHWTDAIGYLVYQLHPLQATGATRAKILA